MTSATDDAVPAKRVTSRVAVKAPFQVSHDGTVYGPNEAVAVPESVAAHWILNGWAVAL